VAATADQTNGGDYTVVMTVDDGKGHPASTTFDWTIINPDTGPWLAYPTIQTNAIGDAVSLQIQAGDPNSDPLTYSASGLPTGLGINATTGLISGTVTAAAGSYTATVTASEGGLSTSQTFVWNVTSSLAPRVIVAINNTTDHSNDVLILGAPAVPVLVTLQNAGSGTHEVDLSVASGYASLSQTVLQLTSGGSATVYLTALQASAAEDDVRVLAVVNGNNAGDEKATIEDVTLDPVNAADTPTGMKDRIPPRVVTKVKYTFSTKLAKSGEKIDFRVDGQSNVNGEVKLLGSPNNQQVDQVYDTESWYLSLVGTKQTAPSMTNGKPDGNGGNAGKLYVHLYVGSNPKDAKDSNGFSVAAIPIRIRMDKVQLCEPIGFTVDKKWRFFWGARYQVTVTSDSGDVNDLNDVAMNEKYLPQEVKGSAKPFFANLTVGSWAPVLPATWRDRNGVSVDIPKVDLDGKPINAVQAQGLATEALQAKIDDLGAGSALMQQTWVFTEQRTGASDQDHPFVIKESGFEITHVIEKKDGKYFVRTTRKAAANNGAEPGELPEADGAEQSAEIKK
jgi:hypothetical protein